MILDSSIAAVVTGAASGLGAATARALAAKGVKVAIFDMNEAVGQALASELDGVYCNVDVTSEEQVDAAFAKATGLTLDLTGKGLGLRSNRYSMLVRDGKVLTLNVEGPGKFEVSDADTLLQQAQKA